MIFFVNCLNEICNVSGCISELNAGGKPSTRFPPGRLSELQRTTIYKNNIQKQTEKITKYAEKTFDNE